MFNLFTLNFISMPRVYTVCIAFKLFRIRKFFPTFRRILKKIGVSVDVTTLIFTLVRILLVLHVIGNFWAAAAVFNLSSNENWMNA